MAALKLGSAAARSALPSSTASLSACQSHHFTFHTHAKKPLSPRDRWCVLYVQEVCTMQTHTCMQRAAAFGLYQQGTIICSSMLTHAEQHADASSHRLHVVPHRHEVAL